MNGACPPFSPAFFLLVTLPCLSLGTSIYSFLPRCLFDIVSQLLIVVSIFQLLVLLLRALIPDSLQSCTANHHPPSPPKQTPQLSLTATPYRINTTLICINL